MTARAIIQSIMARSVTTTIMVTAAIIGTAEPSGSGAVSVV